MATVTANKMSSLISKGKLPALQVTQLIHQQYIEDLNCEGTTGFSEHDLQKLVNNLDIQDWNNVKHWVHEGLDLLYAFSMNIKSDAALVSADLNMVNSFLIKMKQADPTNKLNLDLNKWEDIHSSISGFLHRVLWYNTALRVVSSYMKADWTPIASMGVHSMQTAIKLTNETLAGTGFVTFDLESLKPSDKAIEGWRREVEKIDIRSFLLAVVEDEATIRGK